MSEDTCRVRARINLLTPAGQVAEGEETALGRADAELLVTAGAVEILESEDAGKRGKGARG